jgi:rod shape-determining protein MreD
MILLLKKLFLLILRFFPVFLLFFLVLGDFTFSFHPKNLVTFDLVYIVIYFWVLKNPELMGYGVIFLAGIINDIVAGSPIGISSINYLFLCGIASYIRNITLRSSLIYDWLAFIPTILIINSIHYSILNLIFDININYYYLFLSSVFTFCLYPLFGLIFNLINRRNR